MVRPTVTIRDDTTEPETVSATTGSARCGSWEKVVNSPGALTTTL